MKRVLLYIFVIFMFLSLPVQAANMNKYTDNGKISAALNELESINATDVFNRLNTHKVRIMFYDLSLMDYSYANDYAVSSTDDNGNNYILINEKFQSAPKEAIASLIAHESVHVLPQATLDEEVRATTKEAQTWLQLRNRVSDNASSNGLVKRENKLALMYQTSTKATNLIKDSIEGNQFYQQQLAMN